MVTLAEAAWQHYATQQLKTRCAATDLPISECGCPQHRRGGSPVISAAALERLAGRPLPEVRYRTREPEWRVPEPKATKCTHRHDDLCGDCSTLLDNLLYDLPEIVEQLTITLRKGYRFRPRGWRRGDTETPNEAPIPWNPSALRVLADLHELMRRRPDDRHLQLFELSRLAKRAHAVIDRPVDREITMCPKCREEIVVTNRSLAVTCGAKIVEDDPDVPEAQRIRICDYAASWEQHRRDLLDVNADAMLTMKDLVNIFSGDSDSPNKVRNRINYLIRRHGLPREEIQSPKWRNGKIVTEPQWVYRLGDIQDLQNQLARREAS